MSNAREVEWLAFLIDRAEQMDVSFEIQRHAGWYVEGKNAVDKDGKLIDLDDVPEEHRVPIERGYAITIAQRGYVKEDGEERVWDTLHEAVLAGIQILVALELEAKREQKRND